jgi:hypothetical protein
MCAFIFTNLYISKIEKNEMGRACSADWGGEGRGMYRALMGKPEGKNTNGEIQA